MKTLYSFKYSFVLVCFFLSLSTSTVFAQNDLKGSGKLIEEGIKVYDTGNYKQAIRFFQQVFEGDTNYLLAQYELGLAYNADSLFEQAAIVAKNALDNPEAEKRRFLLLLGNTYDYLGKSDSAMGCYKTLMAMNPYDHQPYYELAVLFLRKEERDSTIYYLEKSLMLNPYHFRSLKLLSTCYGLQGRLTEAWIGLQSSLLIANNYELAQGPIALLEGILKQTDEFSEAYQNKKEQYKNPSYDDLDAILHAKIIIGSDYKIKSVLDDEPQAKAHYAILEKIKYNAKDKNFVMQYLVPLWVEIREKKLVDPFLLHLYSGYNIEKIEKLAAKDKSDVGKARDLSINYLRLISATHILNFEERKRAPLKFSMINAENLLVSCNFKSFEEWSEGPAKVYKSGVLLSEGRINNNSKKEGTWTYFHPNGKVKTIEHLKDGKLVGEEQKFYQSGILQSKARYNNDGQYEFEVLYSKNGAKEEEYKLMPDKSVSKTTFYPSGQKKFSIVLVKGDYKDGNYEGYFENNKVSRSLTIDNGKLAGQYKEFYDDGLLQATYNYKDGKLDGAYKSLHKNGKTDVLTQYKNGEKEGLYERWDEKGHYVDKQSYKGGKLDGKCLYFDEEGQEYGFITYKDGKPLDYEFKDKKGNIVGVDKGPLKSLKTYYPNGTLQRDYPLEGDKLQGNAKFYNYGGSLKTEISYTNDLKEGLEKSYFQNGKLKYESYNKADEVIGYYKGYSVNGKLVAEGWLENNEKQGIWKYYNINGLSSSRCFYLNDEIAGFNEDYNIKGELVTKDFLIDKVNYRSVQYDSTGKEFNRLDFENGNGKYFLKLQGTDKIWFEAQLVNGLLEGPYKKYYADGSLREEGTFVRGNKEGAYVFYEINGQKIAIGNYEKGKAEGRWVYLKNNGDTSIVMTYKNGMADGKKYIYEQGVLNFESNYKNDEKDGEQYIYDFKKNLGIILNFSEGILMSYTYLGKDGKRLPLIEVKNGTAAVRAFYENGQKSVALNYFESYFNGEYKLYTSDGTLYEDRNYTHGNANGPVKKYFPNGKLRLSCTYLDDQYHGALEEFNEAGERVSVDNYYHGVLHGLSEVYEPKTKKLDRMLFRYGYPVNRL